MTDTGKIRPAGAPCPGVPPHLALDRALEDVGTHRVVDADQGPFGALDQPFLDGGVMLHGAVPIDVVGAEVEQHADRGREARREVDLIGRDFEDMQPAGLRRSRASTAVPILPPICTSQPAEPKRCAVSAVVVDLPFVPVMAMSGASGAIAARSRQKSSMSPMISTPAAVASFADQCGSGWVSGTPGVSTSDAISDQSMTAKLRDLVTRRASLVARRLGIVPHDHACSTGPEGLGGRKAGTAEPEQGQRASLAMRDRRHLSGP